MGLEQVSIYHDVFDDAIATETAAELKELLRINAIKRKLPGMFEKELANSLARVFRSAYRDGEIAARKVISDALLDSREKLVKAKKSYE